MYYFAYGSNMSLTRLQRRVPSAKRLGRYYLTHHQLHFHKQSDDGSGKCDAWFTGAKTDLIYGALYLLDPLEKPYLDKVEGLGLGYEEKHVEVKSENGQCVTAAMYYATHINDKLLPYSWYHNHVIIGAREIAVPKAYLDHLLTIEVLPDSNKDRELLEFSIHQ